MKVYGNGKWNRHIHRGKSKYAILNYVLYGASIKIIKNWYEIHIGA